MIRHCKYCETPSEDRQKEQDLDCCHEVIQANLIKKLKAQLKRSRLKVKYLDNENKILYGELANLKSEIREMKLRNEEIAYLLKNSSYKRN